MSSTEPGFTPAPDVLFTPVRESICAQPSDGNLQDRAPGDLVGFEELTDRNDPAFPADARAWRIQYVSTGRNNSERTLVCGVVLAPAAPSMLAAVTIDGVRTGRVVSWSHGTLGVVTRCQPSESPAELIWGATPWGINTVAWGSEAAGDQRIGRPEDGILAGMIDTGWIVTATDYFVDRWGGDPLQPYVLGKIEAANTIDIIRAAHLLLRQVYGRQPADAYDVVMWGHSQGGHAAFWSGQLLESYTAATASGGPALSLAGVAVEAPASTFVTRPDLQSHTAPGFGLFDWLAHARLQMTGMSDPMPLAPFFFSYLFGSWASYAAGGPADPTRMPAYPETGALDPAALVTPAGLSTIEQMTGMCWVDGPAVTDLLAHHRTEPFLISEVADGRIIDGLQHGRFDEMCAGDPPPELAAWCRWLLYNAPGPMGASDLEKLPKRGDRLAPIIIFAGANDGLVHCVAPAGSAGAVPSARDCTEVALYDALAADYCPDADSGANGHLTLSLCHPDAGVTAADHSDVRGLAAAASTDEPSFQGSRLERFISAAFDGALPAGCSATVVNAPDQP